LRAQLAGTKNREEHSMRNFHVVAIETEIAEQVRATLQAPVYGFPAHLEVAEDEAPCRHCLRTIAPGERRILFTYDRFTGKESLPQPGPVYIHADGCQRYPEHGPFPEDLRNSPRTMEAYARGRKLKAQEYVRDGRFEPVIAKLLANPEVDYLQISSTTAGCFTFRIERKAVA
jgi:Protein of unknown function (DUF1203)